MKNCILCNTSKNLYEFGKDKYRPDGYSDRCKDCKRLVGKTHFYKNREQRNQNSREYLRTPRGKFATLIHAAKRKGVSCTLTFEQFCEALTKSCTYCEGTLNETGYSLDRVNTMLGYSKENVVSCCGRCNRIKNDAPLDFLIEHLPKFLEGAKKLLKAPKLIKTIAQVEKESADNG